MDQFKASQLRAYLERWIPTQPYGWHHQGAEAIAKQLLHDAAFTDLNLSRWFQSPDGVVVSQVVTSLLPFPDGVAAAVLIEAITIAAKKQGNDQGIQSSFIGLGVIVALAFLWAMFGG
jgi:hypothetical protein